MVGGTLPLRIESGRYCNELRENRICRLCDTNQIEDQFHFLVECPALDHKRQAILASLRRLVDFSGGNPPLSNKELGIVLVGTSIFNLSLAKQLVSLFKVRMDRLS